MLINVNLYECNVGLCATRKHCQNTKYLCFQIFVCLCFTSLQQRGHLETAPPFTVPCYFTPY